MADVDWIAEAKQIAGEGYSSSYEDDHVAAGYGEGFHLVELRLDYAEGDEPAVVVGYGSSEEAAACDAMLRFRAIAKRVLPEYEELRAASIEVRDSRYLEIEERVAPLSAVLARIDSKEKP